MGLDQNVEPMHVEYGTIKSVFNENSWKIVAIICYFLWWYFMAMYGVRVRIIWQKIASRSHIFCEFSQEITPSLKTAYVVCIESSEEWPCGCNQWYILSAVTLLIGAVGLTAVCVIKSRDYTILHSVW